MARARTHRFPVGVRWLEGKLTVASVPGKEPLRVATPPEFNGGVEGVWSPEDLFVGAIASCFAVTLVSALGRRQVPLGSLEVAGTGEVGPRADGRYGFTAVALDVAIETEPGREQEAREAALDAERTCLVAVSLDTPVEVTVTVRRAAAAA